MLPGPTPPTSPEIDAAALRYLFDSTLDDGETPDMFLDAVVITSHDSELVHGPEAIAQAELLANAVRTEEWFRNRVLPRKESALQLRPELSEGEALIVGCAELLRAVYMNPDVPMPDSVIDREIRMAEAAARSNPKLSEEDKRAIAEELLDTQFDPNENDRPSS